MGNRTTGKTVLVCNPMGADITGIVAPVKSTVIPQLCRGTIATAGDKVITIKYKNRPGIANVVRGAELLNAQIKAAPKNADILVFGYSEGCQVAAVWLDTYGRDMPVDPARLSFKLIGDVVSKYGGICYRLDGYSGVAFTQGLPEDTSYRVDRLNRQYDGGGDFPTHPAIRAALASLSTLVYASGDLGAAIKAVVGVLKDPDQLLAVENALAGIVFVHNWYFDVDFDDPTNAVHTEDNIRYLWSSPTYPLPLPGDVSKDADRRTRIERCYQRPVKLSSPH